MRDERFGIGDYSLITNTEKVESSAIVPERRERQENNSNRNPRQINIEIM